MSDLIIKSPYIIKEILFQRTYQHHIYRKEAVDDSDYGGDGKLIMVNCYSTYCGAWIGDNEAASFLCNKRGLSKLQLRTPTSTICTIGFNEEKQEWYGWSHRAICGFGIGDKIFDRRYGTEETPFKQRGSKDIKSLVDAKLAAKKFAKYVS